MSEIILKAEDLTKKYGYFAAVRHISVTVKKGDIYGLIGKNGAGKTTFLKVLVGLSPNYSGKIQLFGKSSGSELNAARSRIGCMIESPGFLPYLSAAENLEYFRLQKKVKDKSCVKISLEKVGLKEVGSKKYKSFSLGMKQRLGLALAIMCSPELLILDEPINGLDPMGIAEFRKIITVLNKQYGTTIIISSHILGELSQIASVYGFMDKGEIIEQLSSDELNEKSRIALSLKTDNTEKTTHILENEFSFSDYKIADEGSLLLFNFNVEPEKLNLALVKGGVMVKEIKKTGRSLEQYFIDLVGGEQNG